MFIINNNKTFYEHDSLFSLFNSLSRDLNARLLGSGSSPVS